MSAIKLPTRRAVLATASACAAGSAFARQWSGALLFAQMKAELSSDALAVIAKRAKAATHFDPARAAEDFADDRVYVVGGVTLAVEDLAAISLRHDLSA